LIAYILVYFLEFSTSECVGGLVYRLNLIRKLNRVVTV